MAPLYHKGNYDTLSLMVYVPKSLKGATRIQAYDHIHFIKMNRIV